mmetsp:Transcript_75192/g.190718  ORF Transcript_75192/g.190718 Transcript_75192/m.190718 type:complete len:264 (-) Transcript_75192:34-825(-)
MPRPRGSTAPLAEGGACDFGQRFRGVCLRPQRLLGPTSDSAKYPPSAPPRRLARKRRPTQPDPAKEVADPACPSNEVSHAPIQHETQPRQRAPIDSRAHKAQGPLRPWTPLPSWNRMPCSGPTCDERVRPRSIRQHLDPPHCRLDRRRAARCRRRRLQRPRVSRATDLPTSRDPSCSHCWIAKSCCRRAGSSAIPTLRRPRTTPVGRCPEPRRPRACACWASCSQSASKARGMTPRSTSSSANSELLRMGPAMVCVLPLPVCP